jgi:carboxylate-amine ligase
MSSILPTFKQNKLLTIGVELELQLINLHSFDLAMEADDFLRRLALTRHEGVIKPEITQSMIEINSSIHSSYYSLKDELINIRNILVKQAKKAHIGICGGGAHPFQKWKEQRIFQTERFANLSEQYGYLAKQFTVFGQHIHVSCPNGDDALYLCHALAHYIPHFIALSASSPFSQGVNTSFDCSRLAVISAFPLSGTPPWLFKWEEFEEYFEKVYKLNIVKSMKDFYWDIRPKPEYGTIEIRICDTPLTIEIAAYIAYYAQILVSWLLSERPKISRDTYITYLVNRFRAARFGYEADFIDPDLQISKPLAEEILQTCYKLEAYALKANNVEILEHIRYTVLNRINGARWLREKYEKYHCLEDVVRAQIELWQNLK